MSPVTPLIAERRERVFVVLAGLFLGCMTMLNILGITRFVHIGPLELAVGVLPYPLTFLCTDFISELYGRRRANFVVWLGLVLNIVVITFLWLGQQLPDMAFKTPLQRLQVVRMETVFDPQTGAALLDPHTQLPLQRVVVAGDDDDAGGIPVQDVRWEPILDTSGQPIPDPDTGRSLQRLVDAGTGRPLVQEEELYTRLYLCTRQSVLASMLAYLAAQFCDVFLFHFWKRLTHGRHLWLRNNGSTMISQWVDATAVIGVTFGAQVWASEMPVAVFGKLILFNYLFKVTIAALDTIPFYLGVRWLSAYLHLDPAQDHDTLTRSEPA